jgi:hypothetical protein
MKRDSQRWHISEIDCSNNDKVVIMKKSLKSGDEVDGKHFADYLNASMDQWIIDRIDAKLDNVICGRSIEILTYRLHQDYITSIGNVWPKWRALLSGSPEIRRHVLSCSLATADSASPDGGPGLLRAGPRTVTRCLLQAFVFAMVIEAALSPLGSDTSPKQAEPPANFELLGDNAQLFGLLLVNKQALGQALLKMAWRTRYVLLPNERFSMKDLRHYRRIGIAADRQAQLSQKVENEMLITQDNFIFSWLLERPATELQDYLREVFAELDQRVRAGSKAASESTMKKWAQA